MLGVHNSSSSRSYSTPVVQTVSAALTVSETLSLNRERQTTITITNNNVMMHKTNRLWVNSLCWRWDDADDKQLLMALLLMAMMYR